MSQQKFGLQFDKDVLAEHKCLDISAKEAFKKKLRKLISGEGKPSSRKALPGALH
jgi:hypothetical protein